MRIACEVCKQEGYLQQLGSYFTKARLNMARANSNITNKPKNMQSKQLSNRSSLNAQKTLIKLPRTQIAETDDFGVQIEHLNKSKTGIEQANQGVRDSPSLVWGRPAKSVVERPRGFNSHIPRHLSLLFNIW